jgi:hypothetical protein
MEKLCTICDKPAVYMVRGTNIAYCADHAKEFFSDTSYLSTIKDEANRLKKMLDERIDQFSEIKEDLEEKQVEEE